MVSHPLETTSPYAWFATLWPIAVIFHLAGNDANLVRLTTIGWWQLPFLAAAVAMLTRPTPTKALLLAVVHLPVVVIKLPVVGNHEILLLLIDLAVIIGVLTRRKHWIPSVVPPLRWVLLIAYSAIAFSKLNSSFVDPLVSCAVIFGDEFGNWVNVSVSNSAVLSNMAIAITLIAELSIPILLMIRPLRRFGVMLGLGFHTLLALEPSGHVFDFTSVLFVFFLLFLTPPASTALSQAVERARYGGGLPRIATVLAVMAIGNLITHRLLVAGNDVPKWLFDFPFFVAYAVFIFRTVGPATRGDRGSPSRLAFRIAPAMGVIVLLTSLNAVSPYLELRSAGAFTMYSNLSAYNGQTNHYLLPGTLPLGDAPRLYNYEPDPDTAIGLDFYDKGGFLVPEANLAQWANTYPHLDVHVELVAGEGSPRIVSVQELATNVDAADSITERVLHIRPIDPDRPTSCARYWGPAN